MSDLKQKAREQKDLLKHMILQFGSLISSITLFIPD